MRRQSQFYQDQISKEITVFVSAIYDYDDHIPSFNDGDLPFAVDDMIEVTDTTFDEDGGWWAGINLRTKATGLFPSNYVTAVSQNKVDLFLNQIQSRRSFVYEETLDQKTGRKSFTTRMSTYNDLPADAGLMFNPLQGGGNNAGPRRPTAYNPNQPKMDEGMLLHRTTTYNLSAPYLISTCIFLYLPAF
jgi:hypothetical protein